MEVTEAKSLACGSTAVTLPGHSSTWRPRCLLQCQGPRNPQSPSHPTALPKTSTPEQSQQGSTEAGATQPTPVLPQRRRHIAPPPIAPPQPLPGESPELRPAPQAAAASAASHLTPALSWPLPTSQGTGSRVWRPRIRVSPVPEPAVDQTRKLLAAVFLLVEETGAWAQVAQPQRDTEARGPGTVLVNGCLLFCLKSLKVDFGPSPEAPSAPRGLPRPAAPGGRGTSQAIPWALPTPAWAAPCSFWDLPGWDGC